MANTKKRKKKNKKDKLLVVAISVITLVLIAVIAILGYAYTQITSNVIYNGVTIEGTDVGGMTKFEALDTLKQDDTWTDRTFRVITGDAEQTVSYSDIGLTADLDTAVANAYRYGRTGGMPERMKEILSAMFSPVDFTVSTSYDDGKLNALIETLSAAVASDFKESAYSVTNNTLTVELGHEGRAIDTAKLRASLIDNFDNLKADDITLTPVVQTPKALDFASIKSSIDREAQSAYLNNEDLLKPFVVPEVYGITLDLAVVEKTLAGSGSGKYGTSYAIPLTVIEPETTSDEVEYREPFADTLATVTTKLNAGNKPRTTNVKIACEYVNGTILLPGEEFSYNEVVGERTYERGFKDAKIYVSGEVVDGVGGGICQVSSTLYMAALRSDLEITSRRNHRFTVDYAPLGEDATVVYGAVDFKFVNNTEYPLRIDCVLDGNKVIVNFMGNQVTPGKEVKMETKVLEKTPFETLTEYDPTLAPDETKEKNGGYTGYKTETYRVVYIDGKEVSRTFENKSTYTKLDKVILSGTDPNAPQIPDGYYPYPYPGTTTPDVPAPVPVPGPSNPDSEMPEWLRPQTTAAATPDWLS